MKVPLLLLALLFLNSVSGQPLPFLSTAEFNGLTLPPIGNQTNMSVAYNPHHQLYYTFQANYCGLPVATYSAEGTLIDTAIAATDYRGVWFNTDKNVLEGNGFGNSGIYRQTLAPETGFLTGNSQQVFQAYQPHLQSSGAYDTLKNHIVYLDQNKYRSIDAATNLLISETLISGVPGINCTVNPYVILYTGLAEAPYAVVDSDAKIIHLINYEGQLAQSLSLPAEANCGMFYGYAFCNGLLWVFDQTQNRWESFRITQECTPEETELFSEICSGESILFGEMVIDQPGRYVQVSENVFGCDSTVFMNVSVHLPDTLLAFHQVCNNDSLYIAGKFWKAGSEVNEWVKAAGNCPYLVHHKIENFPFQELTLEAQVLENISTFTDNAAEHWERLYNFGDGAFSAQSDPVHTYAQNGYYEVTLTTISEFGCLQTAVLGINIFQKNDRESLQANELIPQFSHDPADFSDDPDGPFEQYVYNLNGKLLQVIHQNSQASKTIPDLTHMPNGLYVIHNVGAGVNYSEKVLVRQ